jgi:hypothetical protein
MSFLSTNKAITKEATESNLKLASALQEKLTTSDLVKDEVVASLGKPGVGGIKEAKNNRVLEFLHYEKIQEELRKLLQLASLTSLMPALDELLIRFSKRRK